MTNTALAAQAIRKELKEVFPFIKFKVQSQRYAGGDSVSIYYFDQRIDTKNIYKIVGKYQYGHFDGMTDSYEYNNRRNDIPQVRHVMVHNRTH